MECLMGKAKDVSPATNKELTGDKPALHAPSGVSMEGVKIPEPEDTILGPCNELQQ